MKLFFGALMGFLTTVIYQHAMTQDWSGQTNGYLVLAIVITIVDAIIIGCELANKWDKE